MAQIYLDHNATTPLLPETAEAMRRSEAEAFGNPSSAHSAGRAARRALEDARERIATLLGAHPDEVTFTSGATEANNLGVLGSAARRVAASHIEHPCVIEPLRQLEVQGMAVDWWPTDTRGIVVPFALSETALEPHPPTPSPGGRGGAGSTSPSPQPSRAAEAATADEARHARPTGGAASEASGVGSITAFLPHTRLVCLMLVNHETGAIQPVRDIARSLPAGVALHCDAVQAVGKIPVNFHDLGATTLSASAHKFGGPKGVGVLVTKRDTKLRPLMFGGHQQKGRRPGTEPVALAVGMAAALEVATRNQVANFDHLTKLRSRMWDRLQTAAPVVLNGPEIGAPDVVPTTLNVSFPGCRAELLLMALDLAGVACSTGSACSSGSLLPSPVLRTMGVPDDVLRSAMRFSFGPVLSCADIDEASERVVTAVRQVRESGKMD